MGYPFFTWWPHMTVGSGARETITLTEDLSDLQVTPKRDVNDTYSVQGGRSRELLRPWVEVRIVLERFTDRALFRKFSAMINHLERGGYVAFGVDSEKAYMMSTEVSRFQGQTTIDTTGNLATAYHADTASVANGDEIIIESAPPKASREYHTIGAYAAGTTGSAGITFTLGSGEALQDDFEGGSRLRYSDFWPTMILPNSGVGSALLTHDHRISYTLDLNLVYVIPRRMPEAQQPTDRITGGDPDDQGEDTASAAG